ncbi:MAG: AMMECR1 domain-containing protein [bacterium]
MRVFFDCKTIWIKSALLLALVGVLFLLIFSTAFASEIIDAFHRDTRNQGELALALARKALNLAVLQHDQLPLPKELPDLLQMRGAVFVSAMNAQGAPVCCMGTLEPQQRTLGEEIIANALLAGANDKRFPPLKPEQLPKIRVIISIIGDVTPIADPLTLDPVTDGLAARGANETGVVLPGETKDPKKMVEWARIRAKAKKNDKVEYLRIEAMRFIEPVKVK